MLWTTTLHVFPGLIWMTLKVNCEIYTKYKIQTSYADKLCTANFVEQTLITFTSYSCLATCSHIAKCSATIYHRNSQLCYILRSGYQNEDFSTGQLGAQFFSKATCPEGWTFLYQSCFRITEDEAGWSASMAACKHFNKHAHLAYVETMEENGKIQQWILNDVEGGFVRVWLGAKYHHDEWKWSDGTSFVVSNWAPQEPDLDNEGDNCLHIYNSDFDFGDKLCEDKTIRMSNGLALAMPRFLASHLGPINKI